MPTPPPGFRHALPMQIRWADMDALGHVNNATYLTYLEQARIRYFNDLSLWDGTVHALGLIMAKVVLEYKLPITARDTVIVYTRCARLGTRSFDTEQQIVRYRDDDAAEVAAQAVITIVVYDYPNARSAPIPDDWRARLIEYEPETIAGV